MSHGETEASDRVFRLAESGSEDSSVRKVVLGGLFGIVLTMCLCYCVIRLHRVGLDGADPRGAPPGTLVPPRSHLRKPSVLARLSAVEAQVDQQATPIGLVPGEGSIFCSSCGSAVAPSAKFCSKCGTQVANLRDPPPLVTAVPLPATGNP